MRPWRQPDHSTMARCIHTGGPQQWAYSAWHAAPAASPCLPCRIHAATGKPQASSAPLGCVLVCTPRLRAASTISAPTQVAAPDEHTLALATINAPLLGTPCPAGAASRLMFSHHAVVAAPDVPPLCPGIRAISCTAAASVAVLGTGARSLPQGVSPQLLHPKLKLVEGCHLLVLDVCLTMIGGLSEACWCS